MAKRKRENGKISASSNNQATTSSLKKPQDSPLPLNAKSGSSKVTVNDQPGRKKPVVTDADGKPTKVAKTSKHVDVKTELPTIQIITGSYERALHGITATLSTHENEVKTTFADSFLFNAHQSAIRCLALSPLPEDASQGIYLATGGSDERVNVYSLSAAPMPEADSKGRKVPSMPSLGPNKISENPMNRELGTLVQHTSSVTSLHFPSRSKLLSASEDNTIAVTRVRDLEVISTVKAPKPKVSGQASGDSANAGTTPAGVNDFAVHPSMKLMVSVGRGERAMRLWNLVTGKKAGVLNFDREILQAVKESKFSHGEGRRILWNKDGSQFVIVFERGAVVFGQDSRPRCVLLPAQPTKVHQIGYFMVGDANEYIALSTEDGRILFFNTNGVDDRSQDLPVIHPVAHVGGQKHSIMNRIKDFQILDVSKHGYAGQLVAVGCSNGDVRVLTFESSELTDPPSDKGLIGKASGDVYTTGSRITCLVAFVMLPPHDIDGGLSEAENGFESGLDSADSDSDA
ncbi:hypothetical protein MRB53_040937 [Persea americana]|nr:hypothetical protein MRB53_040937 [Persea americana]